MRAFSSVAYFETTAAISVRRWRIRDANPESDASRRANARQGIINHKRCSLGRTGVRDSVDANGSAMLKSVAIILAALALSGCAAADHDCREGLPRKLIAWDGLGRDPNEPVRAHRTLATKNPTDAASSIPDDEVALAAVPKYSKEWVALYETMLARDDAKLSRAMIICRGCFPLADGDRTDSIK
jgi:hypothetical protein